ncbi:hypothetical protein FUAX_12890 [Fulvitalea axinellae]|uniref:Transposase DDE domain-containing protein n=1 Tax=Fulvitalea axinellae TaxID=1182444 RepID=A0AAU9CTV4_9BACT|nr:hypothetical protein FUAX_12890 [Fulvitalea axinellae]
MTSIMPDHSKKERISFPFGLFAQIYLISTLRKTFSQFSVSKGTVPEAVFDRLKSFSSSY